MARRTDPSRLTIDQVRTRDFFACARCGAGGESGWPLTTQHRVARGMGGSREAWINQPANLITLCGSGTTGCHGWVEANPAKARELGLSVSRFGEAPAVVPVKTWRGWLYLNDDGTTTAAPEPALAHP